MVQLIKKTKNTAGGFHSWWESNVGVIRKPNSSINISASQDKGDLGGHIIKEIQLKWYQRLWIWVSKLLHL